MSVFWGELVGTMILILLGNGVVANVLLSRSKGQNAGWIVISAGWGFAVAVAVYVTGWASGGHFNPAITVGLCLAKKSSWDLFHLYLAGQTIGALLGAFFVWLAYYPHWKVTLNPTHKLLCFATQPVMRRLGWNFLTEVIATAVLLIGVLGIFDVHNGIANETGPYIVGILVFAIGLSLGGPTGFAINPTRDLCPRLLHWILPLAGKGSSDWSYAWVPILGPLVGAMLGAFIYQTFVSSLQAL